MIKSCQRNGRFATLYRHVVIEIRLISRILYAIVWVGINVYCTATFAFAGTISLETTTKTRVVDGKLDLTVTITNSGNEAATRVMLHPEVQGLELKPQSLDSLASGETLSVTWKRALPSWPPGTYTAVVRVVFADAKGEPFTGLSFNTFSYQESGRSDVVLEGAPLGLEDEAILGISVKNNGNTEKSVSLRLVLPDEIRCASPNKRLALPARSEAKESFALTRVSGLTEGSYPVVLIARYLEQGKHYSTAVAVEVAVVDPVPFIRRHRRALAFVTGVLFIAYLGLQFKRKQTRMEPKE
ncbi:MAG: hypothetical protein JSU72_14750 [Deltaproteobacteria bacterium]|nr:MAG: hypothetical protein JSU72_14750 [Deltaproteobacteria bacterium]